MGLGYDKLEDDMWPAAVGGYSSHRGSHSSRVCGALTLKGHVALKDIITEPAR